MNINMQYKETLRLLKSKNIDYVLIKFPYIIKKTFSDLDVLVSNSDYSPTIYLLKQHGFVLHRSEKYFEKYKTVMIKFIPKKGFIKIHLHRRVTWNGKVVLHSNQIIKDKKKINDLIFVPKEEDSLLINIGHILFENFEISSYDFKLIKKLLDKNLDWNYLYSQVKKFKWLSQFKSVISRFKKMSTFKKNISLKRTFSISIGLLARIFNLRRKGSLICLLGVDGAGKTSTSKVIAGIFQHVEEKTYPMYIGWKPLLPTSKLMHFIGRFTKKKEKREMKEYRKSKKCTLIDEIIFFHFFLEYFFRYFFEIYPKLRRTHSIIADRYFYDVFVQDPRANSSKLVPLLIKLFPKPDFIFFLDNDPKVIFKRKNEFSIPELTRQRERYIKLSSLLRIISIKTNISLNCVANKIIYSSWKKIVKKMAW